MKRHKKLWLFIFLLTIVSIVPVPVDAVTVVPDCARQKASIQTPGVDCLVLTAINVAKLILGISGSVALALFIYGGFMMLISAGNEQMVTKGKSVLSGAVIGLIIIFVAYAGIFFLVKTLTEGTKGKERDALFACLDIKSGTYKADGEACGENGECKAGICATK